MSGWEWFTWLNVGVLALGSVIVFVLFLRQVRTLFTRREREEDVKRRPEGGDRI